MRKYVLNLAKKAVVLVVVLTTTFIGTMDTVAYNLRSVFNAKYYADTYADLYDAFGYDEEALYQHYLEYGYKEGRMMSPVFDLKKYREAYADLDKAFGDDFDAYVEHYFTYGMEEKRTSGGIFDPIAYADAYPDVKDAFGYDIELLINHFLTYGIEEGRTEGVTIEVTTPQGEIEIITAPTIASLNVALISGNGKITLSPQTAETDYDFYYKSAASAAELPTPVLDAVFDASHPDSYLSLTAASDITGANGTAIFVRVIKVETATGKIKATGIASETPETLENIAFSLGQAAGEIVIPAQTFVEGFTYYYLVATSEEALPAPQLNSTDRTGYTAFSINTAIEVGDNDARHVRIIKVQTSTGKIKATGIANKTRGALNTPTFSVTPGIGTLTLSAPSAGDGTGYVYYYKFATASIDPPALNAAFGASEVLASGYTEFSTEQTKDYAAAQYVRVIQTKGGKVKGAYITSSAVSPTAIGSIVFTLDDNGSDTSIDLSFTPDAQYTYYYACTPASESTLDTAPELNVLYSSLSGYYLTDGSDVITGLTADTSYEVRVIAVKDGKVRATSLVTESTAAAPTLGAVSAFALDPEAGALKISGIISDSTDHYYYKISASQTGDPIVNSTDITSFVSTEISAAVYLDVTGVNYVRVIKVVDGKIKASTELHETAGAIDNPNVSLTCAPGQFTIPAPDLSDGYTYYYKTSPDTITAPSLNDPFNSDGYSGYTTAQTLDTTGARNVLIVRVKRNLVKGTQSLAVTAANVAIGAVTEIQATSANASIQFTFTGTGSSYTYYYKCVSDNTLDTAPGVNDVIVPANYTEATATGTPVTNLTPGTDYKIRIIGVDSNNKVKTTGLSSVITTTTTAPTLTLTPSDGALSIRISNFDEADGYTYYYKTDSEPSNLTNPSVGDNFTSLQASTATYTAYGLAEHTSNPSVNTEATLYVKVVKVKGDKVRAVFTANSAGPFDYVNVPSLAKGSETSTTIPLTISPTSGYTYYYAWAVGTAPEVPALYADFTTPISPYTAGNVFSGSNATISGLISNTTYGITVIGVDSNHKVMQRKTISVTTLEALGSLTVGLTGELYSVSIARPHDTETITEYYYKTAATAGELAEPVLNNNISGLGYTWMNEARKVALSTDTTTYVRIIGTTGMGIIKSSNIDSVSIQTTTAPTLSLTKGVGTIRITIDNYNNADGFAYYYKTSTSLLTETAINTTFDAASYVTDPYTAEVTINATPETWVEVVKVKDGRIVGADVQNITPDGLTELTVTPGAVTTNSIAVSFTDSTCNAYYYAYTSTTILDSAPGLNTARDTETYTNANTITSGTTKTITGLTPGTDYKVRVIGVDAEGNVKASGLSAIITTETTAPELDLAPSDGALSIRITNFNEADGYTYYYKTDASADNLTSPAVGASFTLSNASAAGYTAYGLAEHTSNPSAPTLTTLYVKVVKVKGDKVRAVDTDYSTGPFVYMDVPSLAKGSETSAAIPFTFTATPNYTYYYAYAETTAPVAPALYESYTTPQDPYAGNLITAGSAEISGLTPNTTYGITVIGVDTSNKVIQKGTLTVTTLEVLGGITFNAASGPYSIEITNLSGTYNHYMYKTAAGTIPSPDVNTQQSDLEGYTVLTVEGTSATILSTETSHTHVKIIGLDASNKVKAAGEQSANPGTVSAPTPTLTPGNGIVNISISDYSTDSDNGYLYYYKYGTDSLALSAPAINDTFVVGDYTQYTGATTFTATQTTYVLVVKVKDNLVKATATGSEDGPFTIQNLTIAPGSITATTNSISFSFTPNSAYTYYYHKQQGSTAIESPAIYDTYAGGAFASNSPTSITGDAATIETLAPDTEYAVRVIGVGQTGYIDGKVMETGSFTKKTDAALGSLSGASATGGEQQITITAPAATDSVKYWYRLKTESAPDAPTVNTAPDAADYSTNTFTQMSGTSLIVPTTTDNFVQVVKVDNGLIKAAWTSEEAVQPSAVAGFTLELTQANGAVKIPAPASDGYDYYYKVGDDTFASAQVPVNTTTSALDVLGYTRYTGITTIPTSTTKYVNVVRVLNGYTKGQVEDSKAPNFQTDLDVSAIETPYPGNLTLKAMTQEDGYEFRYIAYETDVARNDAKNALGLNSGVSGFALYTEDQSLDTTTARYYLVVKAVADGNAVGYGTVDGTPGVLATLTPNVTEQANTSFKLTLTQDSNALYQYCYVCSQNALDDAPELNVPWDMGNLPTGYTELANNDKVINDLASGQAYNIRVVLVINGKVRGVGETTGTTTNV